MPTLLRWTNEDGSNGQCDSRCQNARLPQCECRCGGLFHGKARTGELTGIIANTTKETLAKLAATPVPIQAKPKKKRIRAPGPARISKKPEPQPTWRQLTPSTWTTQWLLQPPDETTGEITRQPDGVHLLTINGPITGTTHHPSLSSAQQAYLILTG